MRLPSRNVRLALGLGVITLAALATAVAGTYLLEVRATFPQRPILDAALPFLREGRDPAVVLPTSREVEVGSGAVWMTVTDEYGAILASSAVDAGRPVSLASCAEAGAPATNCFFRGPGPRAGAVPGPGTRHLTLDVNGSRQAVLQAGWAWPRQAGYVFVGRSRERVDLQWMTLMQLVAATWLAGMGAFWFANRATGRA